MTDKIKFNLGVLKLGSTYLVIIIFAVILFDKTKTVIRLFLTPT